jgi:hypothetical protein
MPTLIASVPQAEEEEPLPDWLGEAELDEEEPVLKAAALETAEAEPDELEEEESGRLPDWLSDMPSYDTRSFAEIDEAEGETADIFADLDAADMAPVDELPDWLAEIAPAGDEELFQTGETGEIDEEFEEWVSEFPETAETFDFEAEEFDFDAGDDWLAALTEEEPWPEVEDAEEIIAQLDELEEAPAEPAGYSQELRGVPKELAGVDLPGWLQDDIPPLEFELDEEAVESFEIGAEELAQGELPDWLRQLKPAELEPAEAGLDFDADFSLAETQDEWQNILENMPPSPETLPAAQLSAAEIPAWLQALRPRDLGELEEEKAEIDEPAETAGPLAGLRGVLPLAEAVAEPVAAKTPAQYIISKEQQQQIALLHRLTHDEPAATKQVAFKRPSTFPRMWRVLLGLLLFLVVLAGALLPRLGIALPETSLPVPESALDTFNTMETVSGQTVLVAFEYTPAMAGELDPIALMLLRQLAERGNRVLTISQSAAGTAVAGRLVAEAGDLDSSPLGLLTGEAVGLRTLGSCLNAAENCEDLSLDQDAVTTLQNESAGIGLIIVLTSDRNSLINWIEQVESQSDAPVIAAVTQPLGPLTVPYVSSGQLDGTLNGIPAASAYEKRLLGLDGSAFEQFAAQTIVMWVVIVSLVAASAFFGITGLAGRRGKKGG